MTEHLSHNLQRRQYPAKYVSFLVFAVLLLVVASFISPTGGGAFSSVEVQFADSSLSGLSIVPASCPSNPHNSGECSQQCPIGYTLSRFAQGIQCVFTGCPSGYTYQGGQCVLTSCPLGYVSQGGECVFNGCPSGYTLIGGQCVLQGACPTTCSGNNVVNSCTGDVIQVCAYQCSGGYCTGAPSPTGTLNAVPLLVREGDTTTVTWSAQDVESCTVVGTNSDGTGNNATGTWDTTTGSKISSPLDVQTIYILSCDGLDGTELIQSVTVNIAPTFEEL